MTVQRLVLPLVPLVVMHVAMVEMIWIHVWILNVNMDTKLNVVWMRIVTKGVRMPFWVGPIKRRMGSSIYKDQMQIAKEGEKAMSRSYEFLMVTVMLVSSWYWWLEVGGNLLMLLTWYRCLWHFFECWCPAPMRKDSACWWQNHDQNILFLSATHFVSDIGRQRRCNRFQWLVTLKHKDFLSFYTFSLYKILMSVDILKICILLLLLQRVDMYIQRTWLLVPFRVLKILTGWFQTLKF